MNRDHRWLVEREQVLVFVDDQADRRLVRLVGRHAPDRERALPRDSVVRPELSAVERIDAPDPR